MIRGIDAFGIVGVQLCETIDQGDGSRRAPPGRLTDRMVPNQGRDAGLEEESTDGGNTGFQCEIRSVPEVEGTVAWIGRWSIGANERPAAIENRPAEVFRDVDRRQIRRAESRHEEDKL